MVFCVASYTSVVLCSCIVTAFTNCYNCWVAVGCDLLLLLVVLVTLIVLVMHCSGSLLLFTLVTGLESFLN